MPCRASSRREINIGAILKGVSDCVQNVRLDPERVSGFASPNAQTARRGNGFARGALRNDLTRGVGVLSLGAGNLAQHEALLARRVALVEGDAIGQVFDDVAIEIDFEFIHSFRMVARNGMLPAIEWQTLMMNTVPVSPRKT